MKGIQAKMGIDKFFDPNFGHWPVAGQRGASIGKKASDPFVDSFRGGFPFP